MEEVIQTKLYASKSLLRCCKHIGEWWYNWVMLQTSLSYEREKYGSFSLEECVTWIGSSSLEEVCWLLSRKKNKVSFKISLPSWMKNVLDFVHTDFCKPVWKSLGGAQYFVTFVDDHSSKTCMYVRSPKIKD